MFSRGWVPPCRVCLAGRCARGSGVSLLSTCLARVWGRLGRGLFGSWGGKGRECCERVLGFLRGVGVIVVWGYICMTGRYL